MDGKIYASTRGKRHRSSRKELPVRALRCLPLFLESNPNAYAHDEPITRARWAVNWRSLKYELFFFSSLFPFPRNSSAGFTAYCFMPSSAKPSATIIFVFFNFRHRLHNEKKKNSWFFQDETLPDVVSLWSLSLILLISFRPRLACFRDSFGIPALLLPSSLGLLSGIEFLCDAACALRFDWFYSSFRRFYFF